MAYVLLEWDAVTASGGTITFELTRTDKSTPIYIGTAKSFQDNDVVVGNTYSYSLVAFTATSGRSEPKVLTNVLVSPTIQELPNITLNASYNSVTGKVDAYCNDLGSGVTYAFRTSISSEVISSIPSASLSGTFIANSTIGVWLTASKAGYTSKTVNINLTIPSTSGGSSGNSDFGAFSVSATPSTDTAAISWTNLGSNVSYFVAVKQSGSTVYSTTTSSTSVTTNTLTKGASYSVEVTASKSGYNSKTTTGSFSIAAGSGGNTGGTIPDFTVDIKQAEQFIVQVDGLDDGYEYEIVLSKGTTVLSTHTSTNKVSGTVYGANNPDISPAAPWPIIYYNPADTAKKHIDMEVGTTYTIKVTAKKAGYTSKTVTVTKKWEQLLTELSWTISNGSVTITGPGNGPGNYSNGKVTIPDYIEGYPVERIGARAFNQRGYYQVTLPSTLKRIEEYAFWYCPIAKLNIPASVEFIGNNAFSSAKHFFKTDVDREAFTQTLTFASGCEVSEIGNNAFASNNIKSLTLPSVALRSIGHAAFESNKLTSIVIPEGVTVIRGSTFNLNPITTATLSSSVKDILKQSDDYLANGHIFYSTSFGYTHALPLTTLTWKSRDYDFPTSNISTWSNTFYLIIGGPNEAAVTTGVTVKCYAGSTAEAYCKAKGQKYSLI